jgi:hypothetical protein
MFCPMCDHTMQGIGGQKRLFWCPRCGTIKDCDQRASVGLSDECPTGDQVGVSIPYLRQRAIVLSSAVSELLNDYSVSLAPFDPEGKYRARFRKAIVEIKESTEK